MIVNKLLSILIAFALTGCAITHETSVLVGTARTPTTPDQVKLYTSPPKKYVEIAIVSADAAHDFMDKQSLMNTAVANAKNQAAAVRANGLLLDGLGDFETGSSGIVMMQPSYNRKAPMIGVTSSNVRTGKQISGKAIFVTEE